MSHMFNAFYAVNNASSTQTSQASACLTCTDPIDGSGMETGVPALKPNVAIIIIGLGFTLVLVAAFAIFAKFMRPHLVRQENGDTRTWQDVAKDGVPVDISIIKALPLIQYSRTQSEEQNLASECSVCLCTFEESEDLRLLPICKHVFHQDCIDSWLKSHPSCPLCRHSIIPDSCEQVDALGSVAVDIDGSSRPFHITASSISSDFVMYRISSEERLQIFVPEHSAVQAHLPECSNNIGSEISGEIESPTNRAHERYPSDGSQRDAVTVSNLPASSLRPRLLEENSTSKTLPDARHGELLVESLIRQDSQVT